MKVRMLVMVPFQEAQFHAQCLLKLRLKVAHRLLLGLLDSTGEMVDG